MTKMCRPLGPLGPLGLLISDELISQPGFPRASMRKIFQTYAVYHMHLRDTFNIYIYIYVCVYVYIILYI